MIIFLGYGARDKNLYQLLASQTKPIIKYIDYRLHWPVFKMLGLSAQCSIPSFLLNKSDHVFGRYLLRHLYRTYLCSFRAKLSKAEMVILPGKHRLWEMAAYVIAREFELAILFYEAADQEHIYFSKNGVCGEAVLPKNLSTIKSSRLIRRKAKCGKYDMSFWVAGLLKPDSGEFWRSIWQKLKKRRASEAVNISQNRDGKSSVLILGQVAWDLNSVVYGISSDEFIDKIVFLVKSKGIKFAYYKPHPLYFDDSFLDRLNKRLSIPVYLAKGNLDRCKISFSHCVAINSNGLLEMKRNSPLTKCIAYGDFLYSDLLEILDSKETCDEIKRAFNKFLDQRFIKCDYRNGPSYLDDSAIKLVNKYYENCNYWP